MTKCQLQRRHEHRCAADHCAEFPFFKLIVRGKSDPAGIPLDDSHSQRNTLGNVEHAPRLSKDVLFESQQPREVGPFDLAATAVTWLGRKFHYALRDLFGRRGVLRQVEYNSHLSLHKAGEAASSAANNTRHAQSGLGELGKTLL